MRAPRGAGLHHGVWLRIIDAAAAGSAPPHGLSNAPVSTTMRRCCNPSLPHSPKDRAHESQRTRRVAGPVENPARQNTPVGTPAWTGTRCGPGWMAMLRPSRRWKTSSWLATPPGGAHGAARFLVTAATAACSSIATVCSLATQRGAFAGFCGYEEKCGARAQWALPAVGVRCLDAIFCIATGAYPVSARGRKHSKIAAFRHNGLPSCVRGDLTAADPVGCVPMPPVQRQRLAQMPMPMRNQNLNQNPHPPPAPPSPACAAAAPGPCGHPLPSRPSRRATTTAPSTK